MVNRQNVPARSAKTRQKRAKVRAFVRKVGAPLPQAPLIQTVRKADAHHIFDYLLEGCQIIGFDWRYLYVNDAAARHAQHAKAELLGYTMLERYPGIEKTELFAALQRCMQERSVERLENEFVYQNGASAWFELRIQPSQEGILIFSLDITERKRSENSLKRYAQRLEILRMIDLGIINASSIQEIVAAVLKPIRAFFACQQAGAVLFDFPANEALIFAGDLNVPSGLSQGDRYPMPSGLLEEFAAEQVIVIDDLQLLPETYPTYQRVRKEGIRSTLRALLTFQEQPLGLLALNAVAPGFFTVEHQEIAAEIANQLSIAIHQLNLHEALTQHAALLEQRVQTRTAELHRATEQVEAILNNSTDAIFLVHTDLRIQQVNASFTKLFGWTPEECFGQSLAMLSHVADVHNVIQLIQTVSVEQQEKSIEFYARRKDGASFDAELSVGPIKADGMVCNLRDITERKKLERQQRYHANLQANVSDAVIVTDLAFCIQSWNRAAERIYGWSAEEVVGQAISEILRTQFSSPADRERIMQELHKQDWWQGEVIQHHKDDSLRYIWGSVTLVKDERGDPYGCVFINHDITHYKQAQQALVASERRYRLLVENITDVINQTDAAGIRTFITPSCYTLSGYQPAELIGQPSIEIVYPEDRPAAQAQIAQAIKSGQSSFTVIHRIRHKAGHAVWVEGINSLVRNPATGAFWEMVSTFRDITERKRAEMALQASEETLRQALAKEKELGELKSRFVLTASHEFRTPLASILALTETLSAYRDKLSDAQIEQRFAKIREQVRHLKNITEDVLLLARMQAHHAEFHPVPLDLDALCRSVLAEFQESAEVKAQLAYVGCEQLQTVTLDPKLMRQVLSNLIGNAIKYSPESKPIQVSLAMVDNALVLQVRDAGIGIPEADLKHLFEPFHRASNVDAIAGTGLGLVITKEAVELHGGTITVESQEGQGTTFTVRIPVVTT